MFCSLFVGQTANVCSLCGSVAHLSNFCPMLASGKPQSVNAYRGPLPGMPNQTPTSTDIQGRPRVSVGQREVCNNFNSDRGCQRRDCKVLHSCVEHHTLASCAPPLVDFQLEQPNQQLGLQLDQRQRND